MRGLTIKNESRDTKITRTVVEQMLLIESAIAVHRKTIASDVATFSLQDALESFVGENPGLDGLEAIGAGHFGCVYSIKLGGRKYALKRIAHAATNPDSLNRELASRHLIRHPNIVNIEAYTQTDSATYVLMQLVRGKPLCSTEVSRSFCLAGEVNDFKQRYQRLLCLTRSLLRGISHIHAHGVTHRDIKCQNVMLSTGNGSSFGPKIVDWGTARSVIVPDGIIEDGAKVFDISHESFSPPPVMARAVSTVGTPAYLAPEVSAGGSYDYAVDIWSLGVLLYRLVTGKLPFEADNPMAYIYCVHTKEIDFPDCIPHHFRNMLMSMLDKNPDNRPSAIDLLVHPALHEFSKAVLPKLNRTSRADEEGVEETKLSED